MNNAALRLPTALLRILRVKSAGRIRVRVRMSSLLSRREEDNLLKTVKARALKECDPVVKGQI